MVRPLTLLPDDYEYMKWSRNLPIVLILLGRTPGVSMDEIIERIERDRDDLLAALGKAGVRLGDALAGAAFLQEAREYSCVDYRTGPSAPRKAVHAAFSAAPPPQRKWRVKKTGNWQHATVKGIQHLPIFLNLSVPLSQ